MYNSLSHFNNASTKFTTHNPIHIYDDGRSICPGRKSRSLDGTLLCVDSEVGLELRSVVNSSYAPTTSIHPCIFAATTGGNLNAESFAPKVRTMRASAVFKARRREESACLSGHIDEQRRGEPKVGKLKSKGRWGRGAGRDIR